MSCPDLVIELSIYLNAMIPTTLALEELLAWLLTCYSSFSYGRLRLIQS